MSEFKCSSCGKMHPVEILGLQCPNSDYKPPLSIKRDIYAECDALRAEVEMLRGVGCNEVTKEGGEGDEVGAGPCGVCVKCARRERDALRAENAELRALAYIGDHHFPDLTWKARNEETLERAEKAEKERDEALGWGTTLEALKQRDKAEKERDEARALVRLLKKDKRINWYNASDLAREGDAAIARWDAEAKL